MQSLAEKSLVRPTHEPANTHTVHPPHAQSHACATHWFCMLVVMSNTHIRGRRRGREEKKEKGRRRRGRGLRQWQRAPRAPRERQVGAANDERDRDGDGGRWSA